MIPKCGQKFAGVAPPTDATGAGAPADAGVGRAGVDLEEVARFDMIAADWWNPDGKFRPLHAMNPVRAAYARDQFMRLHRTDMPGLRPDLPLAGLRILDVGCGGGLLSETLARWGAAVVAVDAGEQAIAVAQAHAAQEGLNIDYRCTTAEALVGVEAPFDGVTALEVVEHVPDPASFCRSLSALVRPEGRLVMSTLNRTRASYLTAILGAEYVLGWLPRGTHDWNRFLKPSELAGALRRSGLVVTDTTGMTPTTITGRTWRLSQSNLAVNYLVSAVKQPTGPTALSQS